MEASFDDTWQKLSCRAKTKLYHDSSVDYVFLKVLQPSHYILNLIIIGSSRKIRKFAIYKFINNFFSIFLKLPNFIVYLLITK